MKRTPALLLILCPSFLLLMAFGIVESTRSAQARIAPPLQPAAASQPAPPLRAGETQTWTVLLPIVARPEIPPVEARVVWISRFDWCGAPPCRRADLENLIDHAADANFNIVLFQVRATADAYYMPGLEPWSYRLTSNQTTTLGQSPGWDPLAVAISTTHAHGMQLHAYVNIFSTWECGRWFPPHTTPEHPFWTLGGFPGPYSSTWRVYSDTATGPLPMSVLAASGVAVPCSEYLWSSPGVPRVDDENLAVIKDIAARYDVDGIHMDRVRYPGPQFSPDPESLAGYSAAKVTSPTLTYATWQRDHLSAWVARVYTEVHAIKPALNLSAAVWFTYRKTPTITFPTSQGFSDFYQDSHRWLSDGSLDAIAPMIYGATFNDDLAKWKALADDHVRVQGNREVWLGIGGAITSFVAISDRIAYARQIGASGVALWSAGALETNHYWADLAAGPFQQKAAVPNPGTAALPVQTDRRRK